MFVHLTNPNPLTNPNTNTNPGHQYVATAITDKEKEGMDSLFWMRVSN